ncbi:MAG: hypothetical protein ACOYMF_05440 [Bacteroidales bacterium]
MKHISDEELSYILISLRRMREGFMLDLECANAFRLKFDTKEVNFLRDRILEITPLINKLEHVRDSRNHNKQTAEIKLV